MPGEFKAGFLKTLWILRDYLSIKELLLSIEIFK